MKKYLMTLLAWALVSTSDGVAIPNPNYNPLHDARETITVPANTVINLIEYDGVSPYIAPPGTFLAEVVDGARIGDLY